MTRSGLLVPVLSGILVMGYATAGLFFLKFWRETRDRLFGYFSLAFFSLAIQRVLIVTFEPSAMIYLIRLFAFVLILWAIVEKNRSHRRF